MRRHLSNGQIVEMAQNLQTPPQAAERKLSVHAWMREYGAPLKQGGELHVRGAKMINPDGCIDQDQRASGGPATRRRLRLRISAAKPCETARRFSLNQRLKRFAHESGFLIHSRQRLGFGNEIIVESESGAHEAQYLTSNDVKINANQLPAHRPNF